MNEPHVQERGQLTVNGLALDTLTPDQIGTLDLTTLRAMMNEAQLAVVSRGYIPTPLETQNAVRIIVALRRLQVQGNPRASRAAKANADVTPPDFADFE